MAVAMCIPQHLTSAARPARLPYVTYTTVGGAEIRVGRSAADNDALSLDSAHRADDDWWLHASGVAGSHVVVVARSLANPSAAELPHDVARDAALLAVWRSKASRSGGAVRVSLCRAAAVRKPARAPAGMVELSGIHGAVRTISVSWSKEQWRLARLGAAV